MTTGWIKLFYGIWKHRLISNGNMKLLQVEPGKSKPK